MTRNLLSSTDGINITYVGAPIHDGSPRQDILDALIAARTHSVPNVRVELVARLTQRLNNFDAASDDAAAPHAVHSAAPTPDHSATPNDNVLPLLTDDNDDYRTWTFAGSEGSTLTVSASAAHLVIERERSGYDGYRSDILHFVTITPADIARGWTPGVHDNTDHNSATRVLVDPATDPRDAWADALTAELGHRLRSNLVTGQPEPLDY